MRWKETSHTCSHCHALLLTYMMPPNLVIDAHGCANSRKGHRERRKGRLHPIFPLFIAALKAILALRDGRHSSKQAGEREALPVSPLSLCAISFPLMQIFIVRSCCTFSGRFLFWRILLLHRENGQPASLLCNSAHVHAKLCSKTPLLLRRPQLELTSVGGI